MSNPEDLGMFHGAEIDFAAEYHQARELMGTKGTDLDELYYHVGLLYLNTPNDKWSDAYCSLMTEIQMRKDILARLDPQ